MLKSAKRINQALFPQFESLKHGRLAKAFDLYRDYSQAIKDIYSLVKEKPFRVAFKGSMVGLAACAAFWNPDFGSYKEKLLEASNQHSLISDVIRNKQSAKTVKTLMKYYAEDRLACVNLGVCSIIWLHTHSNCYDSYEKHCKDIGVRWRHVEEWKENILDFGFLNEWFLLNRIMHDYDVNEDEFH